VHRLYLAANAFCLCLASLLDWLFGCQHRRTTFPRTLRAVATAQPETYIACLACGRHIAYDWAAMRIARPPAPWSAPVLLPALTETNEGSR